jgi:hypothetical protein
MTRLPIIHSRAKLIAALVDRPDWAVVQHTGFITIPTRFYVCSARGVVARVGYKCGWAAVYGRPPRFNHSPGATRSTTIHTLIRDKVPDA